MPTYCLPLSTLGKPGEKGKPGVKGNPGHFAMKFINLRSRQGREANFITLPRENYQNHKKAYTFQIGNLKVNLKDGSFTIGPQEKDVIQHTALAFVTATLYLLVQPRPKDMAAFEKQNAKGGKKVRYESIFVAVVCIKACLCNSKKVDLFSYASYIKIHALFFCRLDVRNLKLKQSTLSFHHIIKRYWI